MSEHDDTLRLVARHLILAMAPLREAVEDFDSFRAFVWRLGWNVQSLPASYENLANLVDEALQMLDELGDSPDVSAGWQLLGKAQAVYEATRQLEAPEGVDPEVFAAEMGGRLFNLLLIDYLALEFSGLYQTLSALGVIRLEFFDSTGDRPDFMIGTFHFDEIPNLVNNPALVPERIYGWGTREFHFTPLAKHLVEIALALHLPASVSRVDARLGAGFQAPPEETDKPIDVQVVVSLAEVNIAGVFHEVSLALLEFPAESGALPGVVLQPIVPSGMEVDYDLGEHLKLKVRGATDLAQTFGIIFRPGELFVRYPFQPGTPPPSAGVGLALDYAPETPTVLLGDPRASRLQCAGAKTAFELGYLDGELELSFELVVRDLALVLAPADQDGFVGKLFAEASVSVPIPLSLRWSNIGGLSFSGSANFVVCSYPHLQVGPVVVEAVQLGARAAVESDKTPQLALEAGVSFSGRLGPVSFTVEEVGVRLGCWFVPTEDAPPALPAAGNAGPFNVEVGYKAPKGVGLKVDGGAVSGGGYLHYDVEEGRYAGIVSLVVEEFLTLTAVGLLTTTMPDGSRGFSLLLIITAENFTPVQLGYGFTLRGVGGLLGVNRTAAADEIRAGLKANALDSILFPENPVENATQLVSDLQRVFPPTEGRHVFGPMVLISWGTPTILTLELALLLDLPSPLRLIAVGRVRALLPSEESALVRLQMDAVGVVDFDASEGSLDATLVDSTLAGFAVTGDMALRASWGETPGFLLAVGGFHPQFQPPPDFPALERLAVNLADTDALRMRLDAYLALTSNTVQLGARLDLYAEEAGFTIKGDFAFDTLVNFSPFEFRAEVGGAVALAYEGESLMSAQFDASLSGPAPWRANGSATFEFLGLTEVIPLAFELGKAPPVAELPGVNLKERLREVLSEPRSWRGQLPEERATFVSLKAHEFSAEALVHPSGVLWLQQNVLPLKVDIERFGNSSVEGESYFEIAGLRVESEDGSTTAAAISFEGAAAASVSDYFAPAQFFEMGDAEKLSRPSFEAMEAGLSFTFDAVALPEVSGGGYEDVSKEMVYETVVVDPNVPKKSRLSAVHKVLASEFAGASGHSAAAQSRARGSGKSKYRAPAGKRVSVADTTYVIATVADLTYVAVGGIDPETGVSYTEADDALDYYLLSHPEATGLYQVVATHEAKEPTA